MRAWARYSHSIRLGTGAAKLTDNSPRSTARTSSGAPSVFTFAAAALQPAQRDAVLALHAAAFNHAPAGGLQGGVDVFGAGFSFVYPSDSNQALIFSAISLRRSSRKAS